jgi:hypothetical protein
MVMSEVVEEEAVTSEAVAERAAWVVMLESTSVRQEDLEFWEGTEMTRRRASIYRLKNIISGLKLESLLIVLKLINNDSIFEPLLIRVLSVAVQNINHC